MKLRPYQEEAIGKTYEYLKTNKDSNPCIVLPTGAGKTPVIAQICKDAMSWEKRVLIVAHRKELLKQSFNHLEGMNVGLYSAGLKSRDTEHPIIIGGIQSIYRRAAAFGAFDVLIIDEAHLIPQSGEGMYRQFIKEARIVNPDLRIIGLTATPYRLDSGLLCTPEGILNHISHEESVRDLIEAGYLCPLRSKAGVGKARARVGELHKRGGEYIDAEMQGMMNTDDMVSAAVANIKHLTDGRKKVLIFACGVEHGKSVTEQLNSRNGYTDEKAVEVYGETLFREAVIDEFKTDESTKFMVNCDVLTIGFDYPAIDCVVLLRPTCSPGYYYQMCGRGLRLDKGKDDCLILDYGENIVRHGPIDAVTPVSRGGKKGDGKAPAKECPQCDAVIMAGFTVCPECGWEFGREPSHDTEAGEADILSGEVTFEEWPVKYTNYYPHIKEKTGSITMRVEYQVGFNTYEKEWICIEHSGWIRDKAVKWWGDRSNTPCPDTVWEAVQLANDGALCNTVAVKVKSVSGKDFNSIVAYDLSEKPEYAEAVNAGDDYEF